MSLYDSAYQDQQDQDLLLQGVVAVCNSQRKPQSLSVLKYIENHLEYVPELIASELEALYPPGADGAPLSPARAEDPKLSWLIKQTLISGRPEQNLLMRHWTHRLFQLLRVDSDWQSRNFTDLALQLWYYSVHHKLTLPRQKRPWDPYSLAENCPSLHQLLEDRTRALPVYFVLVLALAQYWIDQTRTDSFVRNTMMLESLNAWCSQYSLMIQHAREVQPLDSLLLVYTLCDQYWNRAEYASLLNDRWSRPSSTKPAQCNVEGLVLSAPWTTSPHSSLPEEDQDRNVQKLQHLATLVDGLLAIY